MHEAVALQPKALHAVSLTAADHIGPGIDQQREVVGLRFCRFVAVITQRLLVILQGREDDGASGLGLFDLILQRRKR